MKKITSAMVGFLVLVLVFAMAVTAENIKEGKWSIKMITKIEGMPVDAAAKMKEEMNNMPPEAAAMMKQMSGKMNIEMGANDQGITTTVTQCVTAQNPVPDTKLPANCQETHEMNGNVVNFHVACNNKDLQLDSTGHVTYNGDSMDGVVKSHQASEGKSMDATIQITGKYLGPCS